MPECPECKEEVREWISTREGYVHCFRKGRRWKKHKKTDLEPPTEGTAVAE